MHNIPTYRIQTILAESSGKYTRILCEIPVSPPSSKDKLALYPAGRKISIKSIHPVSGGSDTPGKGSVVTLTVKGAPRSAFKTGSVLVDPEWPIELARYAVFAINGIPGKVNSGGKTGVTVKSSRKQKKNELTGQNDNMNVQITGGIYPDFNREMLIGQCSLSRTGSLVFVNFPKPYPMLPGVSCRADMNNNFFMNLILMIPGKVPGAKTSQIQSRLNTIQFDSLSLKNIYDFLLSIRGFAKLPPYLSTGNWEEELSSGRWLISQSRKKSLLQRVMSLSSQPGGVFPDDLIQENEPKDLIMSVLSDLVSEGTLTERSGWFFKPGSPALSPFHRSWLLRVKECGAEGFRIADLKDKASREAVEVLERSGLICGGSSLYLSLEICRELSFRLLGNKERGYTFDMAYAREKIGGSRSRTVEILNWLEEKGQVKSMTDGLRVVI